jgi:hypothetical protein
MRTMAGMRVARVGAALGVTAGLFSGAASALAVDIYDGERKCMRNWQATPGFAARHSYAGRHDRFVIVSKNQLLRRLAAADVLRYLRRAEPELSRRFQAAGGTGDVLGVRRGGAERPFAIIVVGAGELPGAATGIDASVCGADNATAIAVQAENVYRRSDSGSLLSSESMVAHELTHAFQDGMIGRPVADNWFLEASAEYYAEEIDSDPFVRAGRDNDFLGYPETPLDSFRSEAIEERVHEYGAFRFLHWLDARMTTGVIDRWVLGTVLGTQPPDRRLTQLEVTAVARAQFAAVGGAGTSGDDLIEDELPRFWAQHLVEQSRNRDPGTGRTVTMRTVQVGPAFVPEPSMGRYVTTALDAYLRPHATRAARLVLKPGVRQVRISIVQHPGTRVWMLEGADGTAARQITAAPETPEVITYCTGAPGPGMRRWPGELRFAITNVTATQLVGRTGFGASVVTNTDPDPGPSRRCP